MKPSMTCVLEGRRAIQEQASLLEALAVRCGQEGVVNRLLLFLNAESPRSRLPLLVLVMKPQATEASLRLASISGAVLLFEYVFLGWHTGAYATYDAAGGGALIAQPGESPAIAAAAINALMRRGGHAALISYAGKRGRKQHPEALLESRGLLWAQREHAMVDGLILKETYDATLAQFGKQTRFNLRYYRRRLMKRLPCEFVGDLHGKVSEADLVALNIGARYPVSLMEMRRRLSILSTLPDAYLVGLRGPRGAWISLLSGWREGTTTFLHWQMNATAGYEKDSIGTVMRAFFLEHEVQRGARKLIVYGGTAHTMNHAFTREPVTNLIVRRKSLRALMLRLLSRWMVSPEVAHVQRNFLLPSLGDRTLHWQAVPRDRPVSELVPAQLPAERSLPAGPPIKCTGTD